MKHSIDEWLGYKDMMVRIASDYHKKYPMVDIDDFQQEMYLWFVTHPKKFKEWSALDEKDSSKLIAKSLRNQCLKHGEREKAKSSGYHITDVYYYDPTVVEAYLPSIISESYEMPAKLKELAGTSKSKGEISDGMNWLALRSDIARGYYKLSEAQQNILRLRFSDESAEYSKLADEMGTTTEGARMKVQRALASLIRKIGGRRPFNDKDTAQESTSGETSGDTDVESED